MTAPDSTPRPKPRRWPRILAAVAAVLVLLGAVAAFTIDRVLTSAARGMAAQLSAQWRRPVEVGAVKLTLLTGFGIRAEGVRIGAGPGEPRPILELDRAEVRLELLRALRSGGQEVRVRSAELEGLRVAVLRLEDGTTNVERLGAAMKDEAQPPAPAASEARPVDLSMVRVEHAAVRGARVAFVDVAAGGQELFIDGIDLTVDGLAAGAPLEVVLTAGILSKAQDFELRVHAPPLPGSLVPAPDRITLRVKPVDLTPFATFAPREAGFRGGRFAADLDVRLGAAVQGGTGPTSVRGGFSATGLRFAGQEGGKALDVTLDADLTADAERGDLDIARLRLAFGPASLEGRGKVTGLRSEHPRLEGLRVVTRDLDLAALSAYYPPLPGLLGGTVAGPIGLSLQAAGTAEQPVVELRVDLTPVRLDFTGQLQKAAGGVASLSASVRGGAGGALRFDAKGDLAGLDLRPGGTLAKKPGDRLTLAATGSRAAAGQASHLEVSAFSLGLLDMDLKARGTVDRQPKATRFDVVVDVDRVDVDHLLLPASPARPGERPAPAVAARGGPSPYAGLSGSCALRVGEVSARRQRLGDVRARVVVKEDQIDLEEARFGIWAGTIDLAGTQARLAPADHPFRLKARAAQVQLADLLAAFTDQKVAEARLDAEVQLTGKGEGTDAILKALDGTLDGKLLDGVFRGKDLVASVMEPVVKAIPSIQGRVTRGGTTSLGKVLPFSLRIQGGKALLQRPIEVVDRGSTMTVQGSFAFDGELDMPATLSLAPDVVAELTGGKARPGAPLPFTFRLVGKAWSPRLAGLDVGPAVKALAQSMGAQAIGRVFGIQRDPQPAAREGVEEEAAAAKQRAKEEADAAKRKLEQDAKKALKKLLGG